MRVRIKPIATLEKDLSDMFRQLVTKQMKLEFAEKARDIIYKRTKSGKGLTRDKRAVINLKKLSQRYIEDVRTKTVLGPFGSPKRSNLTLTGELLESIRIEYRNDAAYVEVPDDNRNSGKHTNKKIADYVSRVKAGRPFFGLADTERKILDAHVGRLLRDRIRALNKK